ncbi:hypothetical protein ACHQM5_015191 [Ranunculus cassubicifolius]
MSTRANIVFAFTILLLTASWDCSSGIQYKVRTYISNSLGPNNTLTIHCKSKDDDLGEHNLAFNENFTWHFRWDVWERTLFWCNMWWYDHHNLVAGSFEVYQARRDIDECSRRCYRRAQWDGVYFRLMNGTWYKRYDWER